MSSKDDDERRRRSLEAGRGMLEKYKADRLASAKDLAQAEDISDEESFQNDKSLEPRDSCAQEGMSSRDITQSSVSMSEGEGDGDLEGLLGRVAKLQQELHGKEAAVEALNAEFDHLRVEDASPNSSQSQASSIQGKDMLYMYHSKLQEFEKAITQRDNMIEDLTTSLQQALSMRDGLVAQINSLNAMQLISPNAAHKTLHEKIATLETTVSDQKSLIQTLTGQLMKTQEHARAVEMEKDNRDVEISVCHQQINQLNEQIRLGPVEKSINAALEQQQHYETRIAKIQKEMKFAINKFTDELNSNGVRHQQELNDLNSKHEAELQNLRLKHEEESRILKQENKLLTDRLNKDLPDLESRHAKELSFFQTQLVEYKKTVEGLRSELLSKTESQKAAEAEVIQHKSKIEELRMKEKVWRSQELGQKKENEMLMEQIELHKIQLEGLASKSAEISTIIESKDSIERSLQQALTNAAMLKDENSVLQFKLDDLSSRYAAAQSLIENNQAHERTLSVRIFDLEKSLSRMSGVDASWLQGMNETNYQTFEEAALEYHATKSKLEKKDELERKLKEKIETLEKEALNAREELEESNRTKKTYEKQLKDLRNNCDKYKSELSALRDAQGKVPEIAGDQEELTKLREILKEKDTEIVEYLKKLQELSGKMKRAEEECEQLKNGLGMAWAQCAEVEQKLNQTLGFNDSKFDCSSANHSDLLRQLMSKLTLDSANTTCDQTIDISKSICEKDTDDGKSLLEKVEVVLAENSRLVKELENLSRRQIDHEATVESLKTERDSVKDENSALKSKLHGSKFIRDSVNQLRKEKDSLCQDIKHLVAAHNEQMRVAKQETEKQCSKIHELFVNVQKDSAYQVRSLQEELEERHKREVEELRTYFEQKCRDIEKQYSEEVFSQQSKKMSDNDSEIEQLTDNIYFGGSGDCFNSNLSNDVSRSDTPLDLNVKPTDNKDNEDHDEDIEFELQKRAEATQTELDTLETRNACKQKLRRKQPRIQNVLEQHCQTEWDAGALENGQLSKEAFEEQLTEKIAQARLDIVTELQEKIQAFLAADAEGENNWPPELLELRDKFTADAKREIQQLKDSHAADLVRLKDEHSRANARMIDRHRAEIDRLKDQQHHHKFGNAGEQISEDSLRERDNLQKMCGTLKALVEELIKYFVICEEEVNATLITEVLKRQLSDSLLQTNRTDETDGAASDRSIRTPDTTEVRIKRVHFAPRSTEIVSILKRDASTLDSIPEEDDDATDKLKRELNECLQRLKHESAEILGLSLNGPAEEQIDAISKEIVKTNRENEELILKLNHAENLIHEYQEEVERSRISILELQRKLTSFENKKEIITEGYGENDDVAGEVTLEDFSLLQEKARLMVSHGGGDVPCMVQLLEEFCRQTAKLMEDSKREKEDLQQQIDAADKQLRSTRKFLDEQASEREAERDEAAKQIQHLQEQLKERDREKERESRISSEPPPLSSPPPPSEIAEQPANDTDVTVEALEQQIRDMTAEMASIESKRSDIDNERKAAVEKIWILRDIVSELEQQLQQRTDKADSLQIQIGQLETVIAAQTKNQQDLVQELDTIKMGAESRQLVDHVNYLQEELRKHKLSAEQFSANSGALKQMKVELREMQNLVDKRIKELESMHMCGSALSLSQPSEDVSIREQIDANRCPTPDDPNSPPMLPLDHLLKLKEKLQKHARAEDVVLKRAKDLEMQLNALKTQNEELQEEQEILQQKASEQLFQIEAMRGRLQQHKQSAPFAQRQATSRLELQLHEANANFQSLERAIAEKDLELKDCRAQLERVNQILIEKEAEIASVVHLESAAIKKLKDQIEVLEEEKKILQAKLGVHQQTQQLELPQLIDSMLADKNEEIDHLKEQLTKKEKQLEVFSSLDETQLRELARLNEPKNSARTLSDILSIHSECEEMEEAIRDQNGTQIMPHNISSFRVPVRDVLETSPAPFMDSNKFSIHVPLLELGTPSNSSNSQQQSRLSSSGLDLGQSGSSETTETPSRLVPSRPMIPKHTQTSEDAILKELERLQKLLADTEESLRSKVSTLEKREADLAILQKIHDELQQEFRETVESLTRDKRFYQDQYELSLASESKIKKDLTEVENALKKQTAEFQEHRSRMQTNEKIITDLNNENNLLRRDVECEQEKLRKHIALLQENVHELQQLKVCILKKDVTIETIQTRNIEIENENKQLYEYKTKYEACKQELVRLQELTRRASLSGSSTPSDEIHHLQECLKEKDRVMKQMSDDMKSLHRALETIQSKMHESGNVVELRKQLKDERKVIADQTKQLKDERKVNADLRNSLETLRKELGDLKTPGLMQRSQEESDIEDMVQRELNLSAHLDRQILNAIESDVEEGICRLEKDGPDLKVQVAHLQKANDELVKIKDDLEVRKELLECQIKEYEGRIFQLKDDLWKEYQKVSVLDKDLSGERQIVRTLMIEIEKVQRNAQAERKQDMELIELLRQKLTSTLDCEVKIRGELTQLRQENKELEMQLASLKDAQSLQEDALPRSAELLDKERKKYLAIVEKCEKEERNGIELRDALKKAQVERNRFEKQLELATDEKEKLISSLALVEGVKEHLDSDLRRAKVELKAKKEECEWLMKKMKTISGSEGKRQDQRNNEHVELNNLRTELNNAREFMTDLEADMKHSKTESLEREKKLEAALKTLQDREIELLEKLSAARDEKEHLIKRVKSLEYQLRHTNKIQDVNLKNPVFMKKLEYFCAHYLRADSMRRALAFQKGILLNVIKGHEMFEENTFNTVMRLISDTRSSGSSGKKVKPKRFKSLALAIIAISRMKWLKKNLKHKRDIQITALFADSEPNFTPVRRGALNHSPPVRERGTTNGLDTGGFAFDVYYERLRTIQETLGLAVADAKPQR